MGEGQHPGQGLVDLMGNPGRQLAQGRQFFGPQELFFQFPLLPQVGKYPHGTDFLPLIVKDRGRYIDRDLPAVLIQQEEFPFLQETGSAVFRGPQVLHDHLGLAERVNVR